ncbi:CRTAC1 family protein [Pseudoalteromonas sp. JBTF-M23]|uniref:CRTAC1 family protein n=1 Tax=Pseudoalteromonas caenipelagi TaxID=2726988 RepID=A0A849VH51_9GAMM|nr:CRTAC1 family protein [Pseudoalteromonas caenipelagi]NOU51017.1 CRTAC1 family protein [Pseudoalteromonas caenipelagi]
MKYFKSSLLASMCMSTFVMAQSTPNTQHVRFANATQALQQGFEIQGESFMPGVAFFDFNNDTLVDIYMANGHGQPNALYKNLGNGKFANVATQAGVDNTGYTTGIAVGDLNNDGYDDLYVAAQTTMGDGVNAEDGPDVIYINQKDGTFKPLSASSGLQEAGFTTSVGMLDYDKDGDLDIIVGRMIDMDIFDPQANRTNPTVRSHLYRNNGNLTFTNVTNEVGVGKDFTTWAIAVFDYDNDNDVDIFLGHEQGPISLLENQNGKFVDKTDIAGDISKYGAWMGLAVGDYNNDGLMDIYGTNISDLYINRDPSRPDVMIPPAETWDNPWPTLFKNNGDGTFTDVGEQAKVKAPYEFSWGTFFADVNNDGWQDIYMAQNMAPVGIIGDAANGAGPGRLFINKKDGTFEDATYSAGVVNYGQNDQWLDGRGAAKADINKDGLVDFYLVNTPQADPTDLSKNLAGTGKPYLFKNTSNHKNKWLQLRLVGGEGSNTNAIGARVEIYKDREFEHFMQAQTIEGASSIYSVNERVLHFGLEKAKRVSVKVTWPNGKQQIFRDLKSGKRFTLAQGCAMPINENQLQNTTKLALTAAQLCK